LLPDLVWSADTRSAQACVERRNRATGKQEDMAMTNDFTLCVGTIGTGGLV
jgi:hypothetical protein